MGYKIYFKHGAFKLICYKKIKTVYSFARKLKHDYTKRNTFPSNNFWLRLPNIVFKTYIGILTVQITKNRFFFIIEFC